MVAAVRDDVDVGFKCLNGGELYDFAGRPANESAGQEPMGIPDHQFKDGLIVSVSTGSGDGT